MEYEKKLQTLNLIYQNKDILFGKYSDQITYEKKSEKWKEIHKSLEEMGMIHKDWKYLRDTTWQNWKKRAKAKKGNILKGRGKECALDDADKIIFKIFKKIETPESKLSKVVVPDWEDDDELQKRISLESQEDLLDEESDVNCLENLQCASPSECKPVFETIELREDNAPVNDLMNIKRDTMRVELELAKEKLEIAKRERYKLDLELCKLERDLNILRPSVFTSPYIRR